MDEEKISSSHDPPWPLTQKIMTFLAHSGEPYACWQRWPAGQKCDKGSPLSDCRKHLKPSCFTVVCHRFIPRLRVPTLWLEVLLWASLQWHWTLPLCELCLRPILRHPLLLHILCWILYAEELLFCPHLVLCRKDANLDGRIWHSLGLISLVGRVTVLNDEVHLNLCSFCSRDPHLSEWISGQPSSPKSPFG